MRALHLYGIGDARVVDVPDPSLEEATDAIVRITRSGLCGTDVMFYRDLPALYLGGDGARLPVPLGHEMVGIVEEVGSQVSTVARGDFVVVAGSISDGTCVFCREGNQSSCLNGRFWGFTPSVGGGHAEAIRVPFADGTLVTVPGIGEDAPDELQASLLTTADVYSTGHHAVRAAGVRPGEAVVVIGDGAVGLMSVLAAREAGAGPIVVMGRHQARTDLGVELGASQVVAERGGEARERVFAAVGRHGAPRVIDAVGTPAARQQALDVVRPGGTVSVVGSPVHDRASGLLDSYRRNVTFAGGSASVRAHMPELIRAVLDGRVRPGRVFDRSMDLDQASTGLELMRDRDALKVVLRR